MNHHQWLMKFGRDKVNNQLQRVIGTTQACDSMEEFKKTFARVFKKLPLQMNFDDLNWGFIPGEATSRWSLEEIAVLAQ